MVIYNRVVTSCVWMDVTMCVYICTYVCVHVCVCETQDDPGYFTYLEEMEAPWKARFPDYAPHVDEYPSRWAVCTELKNRGHADYVNFDPVAAAGIGDEARKEMEAHNDVVKEIVDDGIVEVKVCARVCVYIYIYI